VSAFAIAIAIALVHTAAADVTQSVGSRSSYSSSLDDDGQENKKKPKYDERWSKVGDGICFPKTKLEKPHRIGQWLSGSLERAKAMCVEETECVGIHHDNDKSPDFVMLKKIGTPSNTMAGVRSCWQFDRPASMTLALEKQTCKTFDCRNRMTPEAVDEGVLVMFYAPWCTHCQALSSTWEFLADTMKGRFMIAKMDCTDIVNRDICLAFEVKQFPSIAFLREGKYHKYTAPRDLDTLESWLGDWESGYKDPTKGRPLPKEVMDIEDEGDAPEQPTLKSTDDIYGKEGEEGSSEGHDEL